MARQAIIPQLGGLQADCWVSEEHGRELEITENTIEFGAPITDHAFVKPRELIIEFGVTNTPLTENLFFGASGTNRIERAREILFKLQDDKTFLDVQTLTGGRYENLLIRSVNWRTDSKNPQSVTYALKLQEVKISQTQTTTYTPLPAEKRVEKQTSATKKAGEKPTKKLDASDKNASSQDKAKATAAEKQGQAIKDSKGKKGSIATKIFDGLGG